MEKPDFTGLDAEILKVITAHQPIFFNRILTNWVYLLARPLARRNEPIDRTVMRRVRALSKAGRIRYQRGPAEGWVLTVAKD